MLGFIDFINSTTSQHSLAVFLVSLLMILVLRELFLYQARSKPAVYYTFLFPGIIAHELSHVLLCLATFTKINNVKFFSKNGGFVMHEKPRLMLASFLISIAPLASGLTIIYFVGHKTLGGINPIEFLTFKYLIILYFLSSILLTMLPSKQDILNSLSAFIAIILSVALYYLLSNNLGLFAKANPLLLFCLILLILINLGIFFMNQLWKNTTWSKKK